MKCIYGYCQLMIRLWIVIIIVNVLPFLEVNVLKYVGKTLIRTYSCMVENISQLTFTRGLREINKLYLEKIVNGCVCLYAINTMVCLLWTIERVK